MCWPSLLAILFVKGGLVGELLLRAVVLHAVLGLLLVQT